MYIMFASLCEFMCDFCIMCTEKALSMNVRDYLCLSLQKSVFVFVQ